MSTRSRENVNLIKRGWVFFENKKIRLRRKLLKRKIILREKIIFVGFFYLVILIVTNFLWEKTGEKWKKTYLFGTVPKGYYLINKVMYNLM